MLAGLMQIPRLIPAWTKVGLAAAFEAAAPATVTPTPVIHQPTIHDVRADVDDSTGTLTFHLEAQVPPDRQIAEVVLWYDTEAGHQLQRTTGALSDTATLSYRLDAASEGLTTTLTSGELDYWWMVRDTEGETIRAGDAAHLGPALQAMVATPTPEPPPIDFTWTVSDGLHYQFHYVAGSAAERDRFQIGALAEAALARITSILDVAFDGKMQVYLVPRVFWQGGAAYGEKVQLISYLDRNYTGIETWSYFTHEGTHALAQDLLLPKEEGGPDGVLVEGLAVWASDGHYRQEPIDPWVAALATSPEYIPLADLRAGPFYDFQHEISYLQGGSFVKFLVEQYGLEKLKELYGLATGEAEHDEALVQRLYGQNYAGLEGRWLEQLSNQNPTLAQIETADLAVRSFDTMRRYETELDPDARLLPSDPPPEWMSDTLKVFLDRSGAPVNVVLETALITVQERLYGGDLEGATELLLDVEAALDAGGMLESPALQGRQAIVEMVNQQDRAILRADAGAFDETVTPGYTQSGTMPDLLQQPLTAFQQEIVRLDLAANGLVAQAVVLVHAELLDGASEYDGRLYAVAFENLDGRWRMTSRADLEPVLAPPPPVVDR